MKRWASSKRSAGLLVRIGVLLLFAQTLGGCAETPAPKAKTAAAQLPPVAIKRFSLRQPAAHYLSLAVGRHQAVGVELSFELYDRFNRRLVAAKRRIGPLIDRRSLPAGRRVRMPLVFAVDRDVRLVGRSRMGAVAKTSTVDLSRVTHGRLIAINRCEQQRYRWRMGMPLPKGLSYSPRDGEELSRIVCSRPLPDPAAQRSFRYERVADAGRASLRVGLEFNRDFERGVTLTFDLLDAKGRAPTPCLLQIKQPTVWERQRKRYGIDIAGAALVKALAGVARLRQRSIEPQRGPIDRYIDVRLLCRGLKVKGTQTGRGGGLAQPGVPRNYRRGAVIR
jgi:hypothetical protein